MKLSIDSLSFRYPTGVLALQGVSFSVSPGESLAIVGENGAGKTTLAKHLNGLLKPTSGRVTVGDWDTSEHSAAQLARRVGYAFQNPDDQLFARTVREEVAFGPKNLGFSPERMDENVRFSLEKVGLLAHIDRHPYDLPISQRKMVIIAAILAMDTPVVILDEPTTGQDQRGVSRLSHIVHQLKDEGRTAITISHDLDFCAENFDRVIVMSQGKILADGPVGEVLQDVDTLREASVEAPQIVRLALGLGWGTIPLNVEDFIDDLSNGS